MKLSKIVDKVKKYLEKDNLKVSQEEKLLNIIEELENKKSKIKDELKNIDKDNNSYEIVKSIIAFSKTLNIKTIAEYVHSEEIFNLLLELDVDEFQGYYFGKPDEDFS